MQTASPLPLAGRRIVVTRAPEQAKELVSRLQHLGADVLLLPLVKFADPLDWGEVDRALDSIEDYDWVFFTSQNAVQFFSRRCRERGIEPAKIPSRIAAVGPATADAARRENFSVTHVARQFRGAALAQELENEIGGKQILLPRSDVAHANLPLAMRAAGGRVTEVVAFRTLGPDSAEKGTVDAIQSGQVDAILFFSPSAVHNLLCLVEPDRIRSSASRVRLAAIGPTTARAIRDAGFTVDLEAQEATTPALITGLVRYYAQQGSNGDRAE